MSQKNATMPRKRLIWVGIIIALITPITAATQSPLLAWRDPIYIAAGFAGIVALLLLFVQPLLVGGHFPGITVRKQRVLHRVTGSVLLTAVITHVVGLWITSPPDVIDALLFASPTPFSFWGVIAMWAVFASAFLALRRRHLRIRARTWRLIHAALAVVIVIGSIVHTLLIQGAMETISKVAFCGLVLAANFGVIATQRGWIKPRNGQS